MATTFKFGNGNWAVKDGYALAYNDENNNFKPLPFDFTRASSATRVNKQGLVETVPSGKPRIDFLDNTSGHLLLEPSRTNLVTYSEDFSNWNTIQATLTSNYGVSPDGSTNSTRCVFSSSNKALEFTLSTSSAIATIYIKGTSGETIQFGTNGSEETFTLNGNWQRLEKYNSSSISRVTLNTYAGATARDIEIWGAQLEQGSYATSYIPTEGSSVTRVADACRNAGSSQVIGQSEGVVFVDIKGINLTNSSQSIGISDGTSTNRFDVRINSSNVVSAVGVFGGVVAFSMGSYVASQSEDLKIALSYKNNDFKLFVNGSKNAEDTSGTVSGTFTEVSCDLNDSQVMNSPIKEIKLYNTALTDTELQNLTS